MAQAPVKASAAAQVQTLSAKADISVAAVMPFRERLRCLDQDNGFGGGAPSFVHALEFVPRRTTIVAAGPFWAGSPLNRLQPS